MSKENEKIPRTEVDEELTFRIAELINPENKALTKMTLGPQNLI